MRDHNYDTHTEITVSPEDDIELRRVRITNRARTSPDPGSDQPRRGDPGQLRIGRPAPRVQQPFCPDRDHSLEQQAILCTRRPRSRGEKPPWMLHMMIVHDARPVDISKLTACNSSVVKNTVADPRAMSCKGEYFSGALHRRQPLGNRG